METAAENSQEFQTPGGAICRACQAEIGGLLPMLVCPACGEALVPKRDGELDRAQGRELDRRGILLPRRHALGGIITPR